MDSKSTLTCHSSLILACRERQCPVQASEIALYTIVRIFGFEAKRTKLLNSDVSLHFQDRQDAEWIFWQRIEDRLSEIFA